MNWPRVSVIIVSRDRPEELALCLAALRQIDYPDFEVVVVANASSTKGIGTQPVKLVPFEEPNISAARNMGIAHAAGDIVAFIDDDAVPVPAWLKHLIFPMLDTDIAASGGYVIGRNGFSYQWTARQVCPDGQCIPLRIDGDETVVPNDVVVKTEGTNMAVRRAVAADIGFDEAFRFYLDETDFNMRLSLAGYRTAVVPRAVVHHGYAASVRRTAHRVPRDLREIAASTAVFQRKHHQPDPTAERGRQRNRLMRHMVAGDLMPGDVGRLLRGYDVGWADGMARPLDQRSLHSTTSQFLRFPAHTSEIKSKTGRFWQRKSLIADAIEGHRAGQIICVFLFSLSSWRHRLTFQAPGIWVQRGGQFGASDRQDPAFRWWRAKRRAAHEVARRRRTWTFAKIED